MLNQPMTSSSHWRIPKVDVAPRGGRRAQRPQDWRQALAATFTRTGTQARAASTRLFAGVLIGGVLVAPMLAMVALIALVAPPLVMLRHVAPALILVSLLWLGVSIFGAHTPVRLHAEAHDEARRPRPDAHSRD